MPENVLYGVYKEHQKDESLSKFVEFFKNRGDAVQAITGYNSINKDKNYKYVGNLIQLDPWKVMGPFK